MCLMTIVCEGGNVLVALMFFLCVCYVLVALMEVQKSVRCVLRVFGLYHTKEPDHCVIVLCMCVYINKL